MLQGVESQIGEMRSLGMPEYAEHPALVLELVVHCAGPGSVLEYNRPISERVPVIMPRTRYLKGAPRRPAGRWALAVGVAFAVAPSRAKAEQTQPLSFEDEVTGARSAGMGDASRSFATSNDCIL